MKTNHSQTAAFLVFSWMIFLSFFNNKKKTVPPKSIQVTPVITTKIIDTTYQELSYESDQPLSLIDHTQKNKMLPAVTEK